MRAEQPYIMAGGEKSFDNCRGIVCNLLKSKYCRSIIYECDAGKRALLQSLCIPELDPNIKIIPSGVPSRKFYKTENHDGKIKLLFVNSTNINAGWNFNLKGGQILLSAFRSLKQEYPNLELFIRSGIPENIKKSCQGLPGLRIVDKPLPWEELESEFKTADIFVMPTYVTPSTVFLDAMSFELPVITTDVWANPEYIRDGENGLLIHHPLAYKYTDGDIVHFDSPEYKKSLQTVDQDMVNELVSAIRLLVENADLRRKMGVAGRQWVEKEHSMDAWRSGLKKVLDEALDNQNCSL
jgi:glycosyltransferase involved in cell wall biosynthesis